MYVPLRVHGHHSLMTGVDSPRVLCERAAALGLPALALADVDGMAGLVDFLKAAEATGVRPIVAAELTDGGGRPGRVIALVRDAEGYRNLCRLISARQLGYDPGEPPGPDDEDAPPADRETFDLIAETARHQAGLTLLADHPRLLLGLFGRVREDRLFAAISPAAIAGNASTALRDPRVAAAGHRNTHRDPTPKRRALELDTPLADDGLKAPKTPAPARCTPALAMVEAARAVGVATVAVPDVYWTRAGGERDHHVRVAIKHNALLQDLPAEWLAQKPAHLLSVEEMSQRYAGLPDVPGPFPVFLAALRSDARADARAGASASSLPPIVERTLRIAEDCRYTPPLGGVLFPEVDLEEDETAYSKLCSLAFDGARQRFRPLRPEVLRRLDYELATIHQLGFAPYFLLVKRIVRYAEESGIPCVGRGSAADSLVAYCLRLTDADPLRYRLPFERFLNPSRRDRPDIDLDFCWRRRDEVLEHVFELFGHERTAMISTLNKFGLRSAFREAALVHGIPPVEVSRWSSRLPYFAPPPNDGTADSGADESDIEDSEPPGQSGQPAAPEPHPATADPRHPTLPPKLADNAIALAFHQLPEGRGFPFDDERFVHALRGAARLVDTPRHFGLHPGGVVVAPGRITDLVACQRAAKGVVVTQLDKDAVEAVGLVKMDLLGNRALTVLDDCLQTLRERGIEVDLESIPEDDPDTASTLREGRTLACFQIESPGMRNLLKQTGAATMNDVIQSVALIRPGPAGSGMKDAYIRRFRGLEDPTPPHPRLVDVLWDTHGVMLYQEDVMQAAARVAGLELAEADQLRRALQKRRPDDIEAMRVRFLGGAADEGVDSADAQRVWDGIASFASFAFCKAHAVTYGRIAYRAAWLKTHYPGPFLVAFLGSQTGYYPQRVYIEEARRLGVPILPPDINHSQATFAPEWRGDTPALRVGLGQVKGLSGRTLERLLEEREAAGPFLSLPNFLDRTRAHTDEAQHLVQCGAFDAFDRTRPELLWRLHLLRTPQKKAPRDGPTLDFGQLDAARAHKRTDDRFEAARDKSGGWSGRGLGVTRADLPAGHGATLFPEPEPEALVLPGLPDTDTATRGRLEFDLLGLTVHTHPVRLFPCPGEQRLCERFGQASAPASGSFHSIAAEASPAPQPSHRAGAGKEAGIRPVNPIPCGDLDRYRGGRVTLLGWPAATRRVRTSRGELMRFLSLEDESGMAEAVLFPDIYRRDGHHLTEFGPLCITGTVHDELGACTLHAERVW